MPCTITRGSTTYTYNRRTFGVRYKTPDGKPVNGFGHGERALNAAETKEVIKETNAQYAKLISGGTDAGKLWLPSK